MHPAPLPDSLSASALLARLAGALDAVGVGLALYGDGNGNVPGWVSAMLPENTGGEPDERPDPVQAIAGTGQDGEPHVIRAADGAAAAVALGGSVVLVVWRASALTAADLQEGFGLSPRETEVARLLAERRSNREVAAALGISIHTARHHAERVLRKLRVGSRTDVAAALIGPCAVVDTHVSGAHAEPPYAVESLPVLTG